MLKLLKIVKNAIKANKTLFLLIMITVLYIFSICLSNGIILMNFLVASYLFLGLINIRGYFAKTFMTIPYGGFDFKNEKGELYPFFALIFSILMVFLGVDYALHSFFEWSVLDYSGI